MLPRKLELLPEQLRVVVTGIGMWTPFGTDRESSWQGLVAGRSAARHVPAIEWLQSITSHSCAMSLPELGRMTLVGAPFAKSMLAGEVSDEPLVRLGEATAVEAISDAGIEPCDLATERVGVVFGTSKGGFHTFSRMMLAGRSHSEDFDKTMCPGQWQSVWPDSASSAIARRFGVHGPTLSPVLACATGMAACARAASLIQEGVCDVVLAGSSDASLQPAIVGSFQRLGVMSRESEKNPAEACRPFDRDRSGFVIGEGAACLVMESLEHAERRRARWYGEWLSSRMLTDPTGLTQLHPDGESLKRLFRDLSHDVPRRPNYINLHGTGTIQNDVAECLAIQSHFGEVAGDFPCSSLKGTLGHLLGAAGSVELAATFLAMRDQIVPPTANLRVADSLFRLDFTPRDARSHKIDLAWKLSLGFGGHLTAACIGRLCGTGDRTCAAG